MSSENMIAFYKSILDTASITYDEHGKLFVTGDTTDEDGAYVLVPWGVLGKHVVLPTTENLRNLVPENTIAFHPLSDHVLLGESEIIHAYRMELMKSVNMSLYTALYRLTSIAMNPKSHSRVHPEFTALISKLKSFDAKSMKAFTTVCEELMESFDHGPEGFLAELHLRRQGEIRVGGQSPVHYARRALVDFPFLNTVIQEGDGEDDKKRFRHSKRAGAANDYDLLETLLVTILPEARVANAYSAGSKDTLAPSLACVLEASAKIISPINAFLTTNAKASDDADDYSGAILPMGWVRFAEDLSVFKSDVAAMPMLEGNGGTTKVIEKVRNAQNIAPAVQAAASQATSEPAPAPAPVVAATPVTAATPVAQAPEYVSAPVSNTVSTAALFGAPAQQGSGTVSMSELFGGGAAQAASQSQSLTIQAIHNAVNTGQMTREQGQFALNQLQKQMQNPTQYNVVAYLTNPQFMQYLQQNNGQLAQALQMNSMNFQNFLSNSPAAMEALNVMISSFNQAVGIGQPVLGLAVAQPQVQTGPGFAYAPGGQEVIGGAPPAPPAMVPYGQQPYGQPAMMPYGQQPMGGMMGMQPMSNPAGMMGGNSLL